MSPVEFVLPRGTIYLMPDQHESLTTSLASLGLAGGLRAFWHADGRSSLMGASGGRLSEADVVTAGNVVLATLAQEEQGLRTEYETRTRAKEGAFKVIKAWWKTHFVKPFPYTQAVQVARALSFEPMKYLHMKSKLLTATIELRELLIFEGEGPKPKTNATDSRVWGKRSRVDLRELIKKLEDALKSHSSWFGEPEDGARLRELFSEEKDEEGKRGGNAGVALFRELLEFSELDVAQPRHRSSHPRPERPDLSQRVDTLRKELRSRPAAAASSADPFPPAQLLVDILNLIAIQPVGGKFNSDVAFFDKHNVENVKIDEALLHEREQLQALATKQPATLSTVSSHPRGDSDETQATGVPPYLDDRTRTWAGNVATTPQRDVTSARSPATSPPKQIRAPMMATPATWKEFLELIGADDWSKGVDELVASSSQANRATLSPLTPERLLAVPGNLRLQVLHIHDLHFGNESMVVLQLLDAAQHRWSADAPEYWALQSRAARREEPQARSKLHV